MDAVILQYYMRQQRRPRIVRDRSNPLDYMDDVELHAKFRFVREHILPIIEMIHNVVTFQTQRGCGLPSSLQVLIALRFYATGMFQDVIGELVGVTQVTVCRTIKRVTNALFQHVNEHIQPPSQARSNQQKQKFFSMRGIPNIFGCIDGTHIRIQAPSPVDQAVPFMNRKNYYSLNVQKDLNKQSVEHLGIG